MSTEGRPLLANQTARKTAWAMIEIPSAAVTRRGHSAEPAEGLTMSVETETPSANEPIEAKMATPPAAPAAPATRSPRKAMFPVIKAANTFPRTKKLIASTAPDATVSPLSSKSRILTSCS